MTRSLRQRFGTLLGLALAASAATACTKRPGYEVGWLYSETIDSKLDAHWFLREIIDKGGKVTSIELMYCPTVPGQPVVCRTSVVWERDARALLSVPGAK